MDPKLSPFIQELVARGQSPNKVSSKSYTQ